MADSSDIYLDNAYSPLGVSAKPPLKSFESANPFQTQRKKSYNLDEREAYKLVKELLPFADDKLTMKQALTETLRIWYAVVTLSPSLVGRILVDTSALMFFNYVRDSKTQTIFGIYDAFYVVVCVCMISSVVDKFSIDMSVAFGEKNYYEVRRIFTKSGIVCFILFSCFTLPAFIFTHPILNFLGVDDEKSMETQEINRISIPLAFFMIASEYVRSMCLSQGHEQIFGYTSLVSAILNIVASYFAIVHFKMGITGLILTKTGNEILTFLVAIWVYYRTVPESQGFVPLREAFTGFGKFFVDSLIFMFSVYPEYLAFLIGLYYVVLMRDDDQIAAFNCMINLESVFFCISIAFAMIVRTRINVLIGMGYHKAAKNYFKFFILINFISGLILGGLIVLGRGVLSRLYADTTPAIEYWFNEQTFVLGIFMCVELNLNPIMVGMKTVGKVDLLLGLNILISFGVTALSGYILYSHGFQSVSQLVNYMVLCTVLLSICFVLTLRVDWSKLQDDNSIMP